MVRPRKIMTAGLTFITALAIGFAMQYGDAIAAAFVEDGTDRQTPAPEAIVLVSATDTVAPAALDEEPMILAAVEDTLPEAPALDAGTAGAGAVDGCEVVMTAEAIHHAMVDITVQADCFANESLVIHHEGMMFSAATDDNGTFSAQVPALAEDAFYIVAFDNGEGAITQVPVPTLGDYDRAVLQWQGDQAIHMHAREFGAGFGEAGHVTREIESFGEMASLEIGAGGYLQNFGSAALPNALMAEVYTFPSARADLSADVALSAEIEITQANCGRDLTAQSLQIIPGKDALANDLVMKMPDCDAVGEFLVLKNMFEDLTLAAR